MRSGVVLDDVPTAARLRDRLGALETWGMHLAWLRQGDDLPAPFVQAAAAGAMTEALRIGVEVEIGDVHPLHVAEDAAVADVATTGRLVLGVRPAAGAAPDMAEAVALVLAAHRSLPFRHVGPRWPTPANLPANTFNVEERVRVTPEPVQLQIPTWVVAAPDVAVDHALPLVAPDMASAEVHWAGRDDGPAGTRGARPVEVDVREPDDGRFDHGRLAAELHRAQRGWGCDVALFHLPTDPTGWQTALERLARLVIPRVQLDRLPAGLAEHWDAAHA